MDWTLLAGLLILYAPQQSIFHEVDKRTIREGSDSIHCSDLVHAKAAQSAIPRQRRQVNSSSSSDDEGISNTMWRSRYPSGPAMPDPHGAGPSSHPDHPACPMITPRRRTPPPDQHRPLSETLQSFLRTPYLTYQQRIAFSSLIERKLPTIYKAQLNAIVQSFTGQITHGTQPWDRDEREYFVRGFLQYPPAGWDKSTCEEYLRVHFQNEYPGWTAEQQRYVIEHLSDSPSQGFNTEDRVFYLEGFLIKNPWCWESGLRNVFTELFNRNIPRGEEQTYRPLLECFLKARPNCWTDEQRKEVVYGFLQKPPRGWSPEQRLQFMHRLAKAPIENQCLVFSGGRFQFSSISIRHQDRRRDLPAPRPMLQPQPGPSRSRLPRPSTSVRTQSVNPAPFFTTTRAPRPKPYDRNKPSRN